MTPIWRRSGSIRTSPASMSISPIPRNSQPAIRIWRRWRRWRQSPTACRRPTACSSISRSARPTRDLKDYRRSFRICSPAMPPSAPPSPTTRQPSFALFDRIEAIFTRDLIAQKSGGGDPSRVPIFVIGMPRSGTTLVEQIIASHPLVHGAGELQTLQRRRAHRARAGRQCSAVSRFRAGARCRRLYARSAPATLPLVRKLAARRRSRARHRQDAVELLLRRPDPSGVAERQDHPHHPRSGRHLHFLLLEAVHRRAEPHLRPRRARPLLQALRAR